MLNGIELFNVINYEITNAAFHCECNVSVCFVVAMEESLLHWKAGLDCSVNFTGRDNVNPETLAADNFVDPLEGRRLAGIKRQRMLAEKLVHRGLVHAAVIANSLLIHQVKRRAVFLCKRRRAVARKF